MSWSQVPACVLVLTLRHHMPAYQHVRLVCSSWAAACRTMFHVDPDELTRLRREVGFFLEWGSRPTRTLLDTEKTASYPMNPLCLLSRPGCSRAMLNNSRGLCSWHAGRLANVEKNDCACTEDWITVCGDATGRSLRRDLLELVRPEATARTLIWDGIAMYCCGWAQNTDYCPFRCGQVRVCLDCHLKHKHLQRR